MKTKTRVFTQVQTNTETRYDVRNQEDDISLDVHVVVKGGMMHVVDPTDRDPETSKPVEIRIYAHDWPEFQKLVKAVKLPQEKRK